MRLRIIAASILLVYTAGDSFHSTPAQRFQSSEHLSSYSGNFLTGGLVSFNFLGQERWGSAVHQGRASAFWGTSNSTTADR